MATDVRATGLSSSSPVILMNVERLKHDGDYAQLQWSVEDLCEDGGQLVSTGFQTGVTLSGPGAFLLLFILKTLRMSSSLICSAGVGVAEGVNGVFSRLQ